MKLTKKKKKKKDCIKEFEWLEKTDVSPDLKEKETKHKVTP